MANKHIISRFSFLLLVCCASAVDFPEARASEQVKSSESDISLEEYKSVLFLEIEANHQRLVQLPGSKIVRTSTSDPRLMEPVVVSEDQILLTGKQPGRCTLVLWNNKGEISAIEILVKENTNKFAEANKHFCERLIGLRPPSKLKDMEREEVPLSVHKVKEQAKGENGQKPKSKSHWMAPARQKKTKEKPDKFPPEFTHKIYKLCVPPGVPVTIENGAFEQKPTLAINLNAGTSRTFRGKSNITDYKISNAAVAEPVAVTGKEFVLLGKKPGRTLISVGDKNGVFENMEVSVTEPRARLVSHLASIKSKLAKIFKSDKPKQRVPEARATHITLRERTVNSEVLLPKDQTVVVQTEAPITRISLSSKDAADLRILSPFKFTLKAKSFGASGNIFVWDMEGNVSGIELVSIRSTRFRSPLLKATQKTYATRYNAALKTDKRDSELSLSEYEHIAPFLTNILPPVHEIEAWIGHKKEVLAVKPKETYLPLSLKHGNIQLAVNKNNQGVKALYEDDYSKAILKLREAITCAPMYEVARKNLAIAYNNYALANQKTPMKSLKAFHCALFIDPENETTVQNVEEIMLYMNRHPGNFKDRVEMGDCALKYNDIIGAYLHYSAALKVKEDPAAREKLNEVTTRLKTYRVDSN